MGFLDQKEQIVDFVLSEEGRRQLASGELEFCFYSFWDDEVDYDPVIVESGSLGDDQLADMRMLSIEDGLVLEARDDWSFRDSPLVPLAMTRAPLFERPVGTLEVPIAETLPTELDLEIAQVAQGQIFQRTSSPALTVSIRVTGPSQQLGADLRVAISGSDGMQELSAKKDLHGRASFGYDLTVSPTRDGSSVSLSTRLPNQGH